MDSLEVLLGSISERMVVCDWRFTRGELSGEV